MKYAKKVMGKAKLLYKVAKAAKGQPDGLVRNVIYPVVSETTLEDLIREAEAGENHEHQVKLVARASYSHHYRRIVPELLAALSFHNDLHRPVMDALALLERYRDRKITAFPASEHVPLNGVIAESVPNRSLSGIEEGGARISQRPKPLLERLGWPDVVAIEADVLPAERGNVGEQFIGQRFAFGAGHRGRRRTPAFAEFTPRLPAHLAQNHRMGGG